MGAPLPSDTVMNSSEEMLSRVAEKEIQHNDVHSDISTRRNSEGIFVKKDDYQVTGTFPKK